MNTKVKCPNCGMVIKPQVLAYLLIGAFLLLSTPSKAQEHFIPTDKAAHFGVSYALQTTGYGILKTKFEPSDALVLSALATFGLGICWEAFGPTPVSKGDVLANTLGQAAAITTILTFDF